MSGRGPKSGFTLLEIRTMAALVAQNRLAELTLGMAPADGVVRQMGRDFDVTVVATPSADRSLIQLDVMVNEVGGGAGARLTGFVAQQTEGSI
jgi:Type II secretion system (T2SS), protein I